MPEQVTCPRCSRILRSSGPLTGRQIRCPACGEIFHVLGGPEAPPAPEITVTPRQTSPGPRPLTPTAAWNPPGARSAPAAPAAPAAPTAPFRRWLYLAFVLALIPLGVSLLRPESQVGERLLQAVKDHPETLERLKKLDESGRSVSRDEVFKIVLEPLPGKRLEGAFLARDTWAHWLLGLLAAGGMLLAAVGLFETGKVNLKHLLGVGLFTATVGIFLLLAFQWIASLTSGVWIRGSGVLVIVFYIVKFIGFSYESALNPENGFLLSFLGFTCGVGFCEELTKALPVVWHFRKESALARAGWPGALGWREACIWGLVSGVGFGVAEGIMYSANYYNGLHPGGIYAVRFISCVALHAIWSASVALIIWWRMDLFRGELSWVDWLWALLRVVAGPMVLHGLYDTLLKREMGVGALILALISFGCLIALVEHARRLEPERAAQPAAG